MTPEVIYFLKVNVGIIVFYGFYKLLLNKDTFFKWKRIILLMFIVLPFIFPLANIEQWTADNDSINSLATAYATQVLPEIEVTEGASFAASIANIAYYMYLVGMSLLTLRLICQVIGIGYIISKSRKKIVEGVKLRVLSRPSTPFSFFGWIFIHPDSHTQSELKNIILHEQAHAHQWHSVDVVVTELFCIICWMNPFSWLLQREVRANLEYLADDYVIRSTASNRKDYQYLLLGLTNPKTAVNKLYNNLNFSPIKKRIAMMNKNRTKETGMIKYLAFIPLAITLIIVSSIDTVARSVSNVTEKADIAITTVQPTADTKQNVKATTTTNKQSDKKTQKKDTEGLIINSGKKGEKVLIIDSDTQISPQQSKPYKVAEQMPQYTGGNNELFKYLSSSLKYPEKAAKDGVQGRVIITFTVTKTGKVDNPKVVRSISPECDAEALRVVSAMPDWTPGKQNGQNVDVEYTLPIVFKLQSTTKEEKKAE